MNRIQRDLEPLQIQRLKEVGQSLFHSLSIHQIAFSQVPRISRRGRVMSTDHRREVR